MQSGVFRIQAQERIVFGTPAAEAIVAEAEYYGAGRVFVLACAQAVMTVLTLNSVTKSTA